MSTPEETERFTTPQEELAEPLTDRVLTPASIPLPESVPGTPVRTETPALPPATEQSDTPAQPETPVAEPSEARAEPTSDGKPPVPPRASARAGGAPPPLPRRAAARARPASVISSSTPEPAQDGVETAKAEPVVERADTQESAHEVPAGEAAHAAPANAEGRTSPAGSAGQDKMHSTVPAIREPHGEEETDGTPNGSGLSSAEDLHPTNTLTLEGHLDALAPSIINSEIASVAPSSIHHFESKEGSLQDVSLANDSDAVPEDEGRIHESPDNASEAAQSEDEGEPGTYVGNSTWEERTWQELVKLREEMFWARIGGLR